MSERIPTLAESIADILLWAVERRSRMFYGKRVLFVVSAELREVLREAADRLGREASPSQFDRQAVQAVDEKIRTTLKQLELVEP